MKDLHPNIASLELILDLFFLKSLFSVQLDCSLAFWRFGTIFLKKHVFVPTQRLKLEVFRCQDRTAIVNFKKEDSKKAKKTLTIRYGSDKIAPVAEK